MAGLDEALGRTAGALLRALMRHKGTIVRDGTYDVLTGTQGAGAGTWDVTAGPPSPFGFKEINGTTIQSGDARMIVLSAGLPAGWLPLPGRDRVTMPGRTYSWGVVGYMPLGLETDLGWELHLRR